MEVVIHADDLRPGGLTAQLVVSQRGLEGNLHRIRAIGCEEWVPEPAAGRGDLQYLLGQIDHRLGDDSLRGRMRDADDLLIDVPGNVGRQAVT